MSYIDDLISAELPSKATGSFSTMLKLLQDLNIPVSQSKLSPPSTTLNCLGITIDSVQCTMSIPADKMADILRKCGDFVKQTVYNKNQLQSVLG